MKYFKLYGENYELSPTSSNAPDAYGFRNEIIDLPPSGKLVGYVTASDGSVIECYTKFNPLVIIIPCIIAVIAGLLCLCYFLFLQPKDVVIGSGLIVKQGNDKDVVTYNGFTSLQDDRISINFNNGNVPCTIEIIADGIESYPVQVNAGELVSSVPATFTTDSGLVQGVLRITTDTSSADQEIVIEVPANGTDNSPAGLDGYWKGEYIYEDLGSIK